MSIGDEERLANGWVRTPILRRFNDMSLCEIAESGGLRTIDVLAWRDLDDNESGGSELHAHRILSAWAAAGLDVSVTTSRVANAPSSARRSGYRVARIAGRHTVFPRVCVSGCLGRIGRADGIVEIWNGMPFFSPLWARRPRLVFLHHVHSEMWKMVLPTWLAKIGYSIEHNVAPPIYRRSQIVTLSPSSKQEIVEQLRIPASNVKVIPPGVDPHFCPGSERSEVPLVVAVGRLVPVKRFPLLISALLKLKRRNPNLVAVIAGEGYDRAMLEQLVKQGDAESWIFLPGYIQQEDLVSLYRRAWVLASASLREGWGMSVTEAGACGTPAVVSKISGHQDAVLNKRSGILVDTVEEMVDALHSIINDGVLRKDLGHGALEYASEFSWDVAARDALAVLAAEAIRVKGFRRSRRPKV